MYKRLYVFVFSLILGNLPTAHGAEFSSLLSNEGKVIIVANGEIAEGDSEKFKSIIKTANDGGKLVYAIRLNSPGGLLSEGVRLAQTIKFAKMATSVTAGSTCASACFVAFAAGTEKFVSYAASVGVHGASDRSGRETTQSNAATVSMARIVKELGVPEGIIGKMVVTSPDKVVWLTPDELRGMGVKMTGRPTQTPSDQQVAGPPMQLDPTARATTAPTPAVPKSWGNLVDTAFAISRNQNSGQPRSNRQCQPEHKVCSTAVFFKGKDGVETMVRTTENVAGVLIRREICTFNVFEDVRTCVDWDKGTTRRDMKNPKGEWYSVGEE